MSSWKLTALAAALGVAFAGPTLAADPHKEAYKAAKDRIAAEYKTAKDHCKSMEGDAKKSCMKDAKAQRDEALTQAKQEHSATQPSQPQPQTGPD